MEYFSGTAIAGVSGDFQALLLRSAKIHYNLYFLMFYDLCRSGELSSEYETKKSQMTKTEEETNFSLNKKKVNVATDLISYFNKL